MILSKYGMAIYAVFSNKETVLVFSNKETVLVNTIVCDAEFTGRLFSVYRPFCYEYFYLGFLNTELDYVQDLTLLKHKPYLHMVIHNNTMHKVLHKTVHEIIIQILCSLSSLLILGIMKWT
jgi:hypothetical protein